VSRPPDPVFDSQGFLVAILDDADHAEQARAALTEAGFADRDLRVDTSRQILEGWERFRAERSLAQRVVGAVTDDPDTIELYFGYAREGRSAVWVHVPDDATPIGPSAAWPTTRSSTSATTATTASKTSTSAEARPASSNPAARQSPVLVRPGRRPACASPTAPVARQLPDPRRPMSG
jgi:hypothetical protein